ncbi:helix-turn-helix transcriptional regulator [Sodalis endosymbiont of Spalangia cameroni]|uniref:helix-turn-helix transcriptional regulator n=1 Tax=Sodalis praecaptivus TaxID=1239307 RepID=UPI0031F950FC
MNELTPRTIVERLTSYGLTQKQIENRCGVSQASISRLLAGSQKDPKVSTLRALERLLLDVETIHKAPSTATSTTKAK